MMIKMKMIVLKKKVINIMKINVIIRIMTMMIVIGNDDDSDNNKDDSDNNDD